MIGWSALALERSRNRRLWSAILGGILLVGVSVRLVEFTYDRLDYDEYRLMIGVNGGLADYLEPLEGSNSLQFPIHYWVSYRLLGGSLQDFRAFSLIAGIALLLLTLRWLGKAWPGNNEIKLVVLLLLAMDGNALDLTRYAMFAYCNTLLLSAWLFFLCMRLAGGPIDRREWLWIWIVLPVVAFFSNDFMLVPLGTGVISAIVLRWAHSPREKKWRGAFSSLMEWRALGLIPLTYAVRQLAFPYTLWGPSKRVDQLGLFFQTSSFPATLRGVIGYLGSTTYSLFYEMLTPAGIRNTRELGLGFLVLCGFFAVTALIQIATHRADRNGTFTGLFFVTTLASVAVGGLVGIYPYGTVRYIPYLTVPCAILVGMGACVAQRVIAEALDSRQLRRFLLASGTAAVLVGGSYMVVWRYEYVKKVEKANEEVLSWLRSQNADLVLTDFYAAVILPERAPELYRRSHTMGRPSYYGGDEVTPGMAEAIAGMAGPESAESVLVVMFRGSYGATDETEGLAERYPNWSGMLAAHFRLEATMESDSLWGGVYRRD